MNTLKKNRAKIIMLMGVLAAIMTGCSTPKQYYSDKVVDDYITWKIPGCELVDIEASDKEDTKNIYTYEDKYGREFYVENIVEYAQDLSGKDIKWMQTKYLVYTYETNVFAYEKDTIEEYLDDEDIDYEIVESEWNTYLYLYIDDPDEDTLEYMAGCCDYIINDILRCTINHDKDKGNTFVHHWDNAYVVVRQRKPETYKKGQEKGYYQSLSISKSLDADEIYEKLMKQ